MTNLAFGGKLIHGGVDVGSLLPADDHCNHNVRATNWQQALGNDNSSHGGYGLFDNQCGDDIRKQVILTLQGVNGALVTTAPARGSEDFATWPAWNDITHQKMWVDWIRRAKDGGLRVMVALATNNKTLGDAVAGPGDYATDDRTSADLQISEMKGFIGRHPDFMEIAYTPADLARIVLADKLAIVLGVEIDNIGNFNKTPGVTQAAVTSEIQRLYAEGIRYIFPIHVMDNVFGGTAVYEGAFNTANYREAGHFWDLECSKPADGIQYTYQPGPFDVGVAFVKATKLGIDILRNPPMPPTCAAGTGHVNVRGLTTLGEFAIKEMMKRGMIIDIDHMSQKSANRGLEIAEAVTGGYPLTSGHTGIRGTAGAVSENTRTTLQLQRIAALHGMFGLGTASADAYRWVGLYTQAVVAMPNAGAVAMGTDMNGLVTGPMPRSGSNVIYDSSFPRSHLGSRDWDYNKDGVAHYGMLSDWQRDVRTAPGGAEVVDNYLNRSADYFWHMWQKCETQKVNVH